MVEAYFVAAFIVILSIAGKKSKASTLSSFEYPNASGKKTYSNTFRSSLAMEDLVVLLLIISTLPSIIYTALNYMYRSGSFNPEHYNENMRVVNIIVGGFINLALLVVAFSLKGLRIRGILICLVLIQLSLYLFNNFFNNQN